MARYQQKLTLKSTLMSAELRSLKFKERQRHCGLLLPPREAVEDARLDRHVLRKVQGDKRLHDLISILKVFF